VYSTEQAELARSIADGVRRWKMIAPAILLLEAHRPFALLAGQALLLAEPLITVFVGPQQARRVAQLLEDPDGIELIVRQLEA
jgi:hypothetical protein